MLLAVPFQEVNHDFTRVVLVSDLCVHMCMCVQSRLSPCNVGVLWLEKNKDRCG